MSFERIARSYIPLSRNDGLNFSFFGRCNVFFVRLEFSFRVFSFSFLSLFSHFFPFGRIWLEDLKRNVVDIFNWNRSIFTVLLLPFYLLQIKCWQTCESSNLLFFFPTESVRNSCSEIIENNVFSHGIRTSPFDSFHFYVFIRVECRETRGTAGISVCFQQFAIESFGTDPAKLGKTKKSRIIHFSQIETNGPLCFHRYHLRGRLNEIVLNN